MSIDGEEYKANEHIIYNGIMINDVPNMAFIIGYTNASWTLKAWLPDGYSKIFRLYVFGPSGLKDYGSAVLRCKI